MQIIHNRYLVPIFAPLLLLLSSHLAQAKALTLPAIQVQDISNTETGQEYELDTQAISRCFLQSYHSAFSTRHTCEEMWLPFEEV